MGRQKGSKNKPKIGPFNPDNLQAEVDEVFKPVNIISRLPEEVISEKPVFDAVRINKRIKELQVDTPYPSNWDSLGKVAKLEWYTANRKK